MKKMTKLAAVFAALVLALGLVACSNGSNPSGSGSSAANASNSSGGSASAKVFAVYEGEGTYIEEGWPFLQPEGKMTFTAYDDNSYSVIFYWTDKKETYDVGNGTYEIISGDATNGKIKSTTKEWIYLIDGKLHKHTVSGTKDIANGSFELTGITLTKKE